ncbi:Uncharacterized protein PCOAH_00021350 [Plasmodium coatneyi]|uniref:KIR protein n=1 Tax=Plasmodium coatneyi TaxID=208452 RepID=A0A1B1DZ98_9APIC|nr:Uncharacterized protein PCOAH_00021350 [Plasmodium coatneyi]ANQ07939.1 Uncharacterized protein PCOAH_00021350 [Plasmodium coatneyi]
MAPDQEKDKLPSQKVYEALDGSGSTSECKTTVIEKSLLWSRTYVGQHKEEIKKACCYASELGRNEEPLHNYRCPFLFYWIIDKIKGALHSGVYQEATQDVYILLNSFKPEWKCSNAYNGMGEYVFKYSKEVFDHNYNIRVLRNNPSCDQYMQGREYTTHLEGAKTAYGWLSGNCTTATNESYCPYIKLENNQWIPKELSQLECDAVVAADLESKAAGLTGPLTEEHLNKLPSVKIYKQLDGKAESYSNKDCNTEVMQGLQEKVTDNSTREKIMRVLCYIHEIKGNKGEGRTWCDLFYYWMGGILSEALTDDFDFQSTMNSCYSRMDGSKEKHGCNFMYLFEKKLFKALKMLFHYKLDEVIIKKQLEGGNKKCTEKYHTYLEDVKKAYKKIKQNCTNERNRECYNKFEELYEGYENEEDLGLNCELTGAGHGKEAEGSPNQGKKAEGSPNQGKKAEGTPNQGKKVEGGSAASSAIAPAAVSGGALAALGLPALAYFFYKYKPFFLNKRNHSGGGSRKKRSLRRKFNEFEEDDDTLTTINLSEYSIPYTSSSSSR